LGFAGSDAVNGFNELAVWDFGARRRPFTLRMAGKALGAAVLAPDGTWVAAGNDATPVLWWRISGQEASAPVQVGGRPGCLGVSPDSATLVIGDENGTVRLWDVNTWSDKGRLHHGPNSLSSVAFSSDGGVLVTADEAGTLRFWEKTQTWRQFGVLIGDVEIVSMMFFPGNRTLVCGRRDGTIQLVDASTCQERMVWKAHDNAVLSLAVTPDGGTLVSGTMGNAVRVWRTATDAEAVSRKPRPTESNAPASLPAVLWPTGKRY
jgi:WD40 repeat protein